MKAGTFGSLAGRSGSKVIADSLRIAAAATTLISLLAVVFGCLSLAYNADEMYAVPVLGALSLSLIGLFFFRRRSLGSYQFILLLMAAIALASALVVSALPEYWQGLNIHGIIHRSLVSGLLMVAVGLPAVCYSLFHMLGATPRAFDISRYPLLAFLAITAAIAYGLVVFYVLEKGALQLNWSLFTTPFISQSKLVEVWKDGWPTFSFQDVKQVGLLNHITGTLLLMGLTSLISLPIGMSVGIFIYEYAGPRLAGIFNFSTTALRAISGIILAVTALRLLSLPTKGTFLYDIFHGFGYDVNGVLQTGRSSFLLASIFISLLVIPLIAKATQEGLSSLPGDIKEGSLALGASKEHTLFHVQLPWSLPNIVTGLMLGCAEAAGALTIIFLIAGTGDFGVSPLNETTSLAYFIFDCRYGTMLGDAVQGIMSSYQYTAAVILLIMTVGLTAAALIMKRNLAKRYKGA